MNLHHYDELPLKRLNTNFYNTYQNEIIRIRNYYISIQGNSTAKCKPNENYKNPLAYTNYEVIITDEQTIVVPMAYKEYFDTNGLGQFVPKEIVIKILNYIKSPICMVMGTDCN